MSSEILRSFRRNAVHVRQALDLFAQPAAAVKPQKDVTVEGGYLQDAGLIERYKRLSIPVRRALNDHDRASFAQALTAIRSVPGALATVAAADRAWTALAAELDSTVGLGGSKVPRRQILGAWLDAAAFYDKLERDRAYDTLVDQWGKAAEAIGAQLTEQAAQAIVLLDEAAATALGEPVILPPPPKTPPPPPDPKESWWTRIRAFRWKPRDL